MRNNKKYSLKKIVYLIFGFIFLIIAYFGIIMPGIPGIPFIILSAWCFVRGSESIYKWLLNRKIIGDVIRKYMSEDKVSNKAKWFVISQLWISIIVAQVIFINQLSLYLLINIVGILGSFLLFKIL